MIELTNAGLHCLPGNFYIDPHKKVDCAIITHAHADHAYRGHAKYVCCDRNEPILLARLAKNIRVQAHPFGQPFEINGVLISFHPAGHIAGSAQVRIEYQGEVWAISGDYKLEDDGFTEPYESIKCDHFISECTFGLPYYRWVKQDIVQEQMSSWAATVKQAGGIALFNAYSLGKAQRIIHMLGEVGQIFVDPTVAKMNIAVEKAGYTLPDWKLLDDSVSDEVLKSKAIVIGGNKVHQYLVSERSLDVYHSVSSGWMALPSRAKSSNADATFVLSDHADWPGLNWAIKQSGADHIYLMHGETSALKNFWEAKGKHVRDWNINQAFF